MLCVGMKILFIQKKKSMEMQCMSQEFFLVKIKLKHLSLLNSAFYNLDLYNLVTDTDDDNYRPSKRARADFRPPAGPRSHDDTDGMQSSPGRSQRGHSREDVPMTDQTDDDPDEVLASLKFIPLASSKQ
jgi:hypothetical protein